MVRRIGNPIVLKVAASLTSQDIQRAFKKLIMESATYENLVSKSSVLRGELGLENPIGKLNDIIDTWSKSINFTFRKVRRSALGISGGFTIRFIRSSWRDVLSSPSAKQENISRRSERGEAPKSLNWLEWLLIRGDEKIIVGFDATFAKRHGAESGRTKLAIMFKPKVFRSWSVPPGFSGTANKNFVTQVLDKMEVPVLKAMEDGLRFAIRKA